MYPYKCDHCGANGVNPRYILGFKVCKKCYSYISDIVNLLVLSRDFYIDKAETRNGLMVIVKCKVGSDHEDDVKATVLKQSVKYS